jgi:hypothetical protein
MGPGMVLVKIDTLGNSKDFGRKSADRFPDLPE